ncbi:hypothetical protein [Streptomyces sp. NPDC096030]|uniref:hypothetical protein n=1 Tax=Streptomyces sp. NPDC096030 TaxID=3155423 RepID=UPI0033278FF9
MHDGLPADDEQCERLATDLAHLLDGEPARTSSAICAGDGGSFTRRHCYDEHGEFRPALEEDGVDEDDPRVRHHGRLGLIETADIATGLKTARGLLRING